MEHKKGKNKGIRVILLWSNFLFVIFVKKNLVGAPTGNVAFAIGSVVCLTLALILSDIMFRYLQKRDLVSILVLIWIGIVALGIKSC